MRVSVSSQLFWGNSLSANCPRANYLGDNYRGSNYFLCVGGGGVQLSGGERNYPGGGDYLGGKLSERQGANYLRVHISSQLICGAIV